MSDEKKAAITGPADAGNNRKKYIVNGHTFEVPWYYHLVKVVGFGAYGIVVSAKDELTEKKVAIKKIQNVFKDVGDCKRVLREVKLMKFAQHENLLGIISMYVGVNKDTFQDIYIVSDLLDTDLNTVIRSKQKMSEEHLKYFIYQVLRGLKFLHSANVMHRDLKPANLLVNINCDLRLCDYGLARGVLDNSDQNNIMTDYVVTRWYRPPELLLMNKIYNCSVDIWSVGCIFAELINRKPLFQGKDYLAQISLICNALGTPDTENLDYVQNKEAAKYLRNLPKKRAPPLQDLVPNLSPDGVDFLSRMLQFNPAHRASAADLMAHPYLGALHDPNDEPSAELPFAWEHDANEKLTKLEMREMFWDEAQKYKDQNPDAPPASA